MNTKPMDVDRYLSTLPDDAREALAKLRRAIKAAAPGAVESISYGLPAFKYQGRPLVYFGAAKKHCALYGLSTEIASHPGLAAYDTSKGTIRFPPGEPLPESLVGKLLRARIDAIEAAGAARKRKK